MDRDRMERVLQEEEEALTNDLLTIPGLTGALPAINPQLVPQATLAPSENADAHVAFSLN